MSQKVFLNLASVIVVAFFCTIVGAIGVNSAQAAIIYVDVSNPNLGSGTEDNPYQLIGQAVGAASSGDTIFIEQGDYTNTNQAASPFPISVNKELTIEGQDKDQTIIDAEYLNDDIFDVTSGGVLIQNITFQGYDQNPGGRALDVNTNDGVVEIRNCFFNGQQNSWSPIITTTSNGAEVAIHHSEFQDNKSEAVHFNRITDTSQVSFSNNLVYSTTGSALGMGPIVGPFDPDPGTLRALIFNNILVGQETGVVIFNWSATASSGSEGLIYNNVFIDNTFGVDVNDTNSSSTIRNNIFVDNDTAVNAGNFSGTAGPATSDYNNFYGNATDYSSVGGGANDLTEDPLFISYTTGMAVDEMNLHLRSSSPLIDAGIIDVSILDFDYDDNRRPIGSSFDIGPYEMDYTLPEITGRFPADGEEAADVESLISYSAVDNESGIDYDSVQVTAEGSESGVVSGDVTILPSAGEADPNDELVVDFVAREPFTYGETITVEARISDNNHVPNELIDNWSFTVEDNPGLDEGDGLSSPVNGFVVTSPDGGGGPHYQLYKPDGTLLSSFFAYNQYLRGGFKAFPADINGSGGDEVITIPGWGFGPHLRAFQQSGQEITSFMIYNPGFRGGLQGIAADFDQDGREEIITTPSGAGGPQVRIFKYRDGVFEIVDQFMAYSPVFHGGVNLAAGDLTGDGIPELVTVPRYGGSANVRIYQYDNGQFDLLDWAIVYNDQFHGGANLAIGDMDGDSQAELITAPRSKGGPNVRIFGINDSGQIQEKDNFLAYDDSYRGGLALAVGDVNYDGDDELITAPASPGGPNVRIYQYSNGDYSQLLDWFMVGGASSTFRSGLNIKAGDLDDDGRAEIVASPLGEGPRVRIYSLVGSEMELLSGFWAYGQGDSQEDGNSTTVQNDISINVGRR